MSSDTVNIHFIRVTVLLVILVTALAVLSACSEPEPTPTPTPLPTATPTPTPPPTATPPPASGAPQLLLGEDVMAMLPAEEVECVRTTVGEDLYALMLLTPFTSALISGDAAATSPVTACFSPESQALIAQAIMAAEANPSQ